MLTLSQVTHNLNLQPDSNTEWKELLSYLDFCEKQIDKRQPYILSENDVDFEK